MSPFERIVLWEMINDVTRHRQNKESPLSLNDRRWIATLSFLAKHCVIPMSMEDRLLETVYAAVKLLDRFRVSRIINALTFAGVHECLDLMPPAVDNGVSGTNVLNRYTGQEYHAGTIVLKMREFTRNIEKSAKTKKMYNYVKDTAKTLPIAVVTAKANDTGISPVSDSVNEVTTTDYLARLDFHDVIVDDGHLFDTLLTVLKPYVLLSTDFADNDVPTWLIPLVEGDTKKPLELLPMV